MRYKIESRGEVVAVGWAQGRSHKNYEDRYRLLTRQIPLVQVTGRGELLAVMDGVGSAPQGLQAAQSVADALLEFFRNSIDLTVNTCAPQEHELLYALCNLLQRTSQTIQSWGWMDGSSLRPLGAAAASVAWITPNQSTLHVLHAGDTQALLLREDGTRRLLSTLEQTVDGALSNYFGSPKLNLRHQACVLAPGDRLLLSSDGVSKVLAHQQIADLSNDSVDASALCKAVLERCVQRTGDDITLVVYDMI